MLKIVVFDYGFNQRKGLDICYSGFLGENVIPYMRSTKTSTVYGLDKVLMDRRGYLLTKLLKYVSFINTYYIHFSNKGFALKKLNLKFMTLTACFGGNIKFLASLSDVYFLM